jgi:hypothetical protein
LTVCEGPPALIVRPRLRKFTLTAHVAFSVGWLGAVIAYLALALTALNSPDLQTVRAAFLAMEIVGWFVLVPCSLAALATGLVQSLGTEWGLFRHYWVLTKFVLTVVGTAILLAHMRKVSGAAAAALSGGDFGALRHPTYVVHPAGGLLVLLTATALSVYKPWGRIAYGRRRQAERRPSSQPPLTPRTMVTHEGGDESAAPTPLSPTSHDSAGVVPEAAAGTNRGLYVLLGVIALALLFVGLHLAGVVGPANH